jgi:phage shock protein A
MDELLATGVLDDASRPAGRDDIQLALDAAGGGADVDRELGALKARALPAGAAPTALGQRGDGRPEQGGSQ